MSQLGIRYQAIVDRVENAARAAGRDSSEITLIVVTKNHPASLVQELIELGAGDFGENKDQEAALKAPTTPMLLFIIIAIEIRLITTMCPAEILANKRIISEKGLVMVPRSSIGAKITFIGAGTPGIQKMCFQ